MRVVRPLRSPGIRILLLLLLLAPAGSARAQDTSPGAAAERAGARRAESGDRIIVRVAREPELGDTVMVDARGEITLPRIGVIAATGTSIRQLEDSLRVRYATFLRNPAVSIVVLRRVSVNGAVDKPNVYYVEGAQTLRDVLALAGGITENGDESRVSIVRRGERIAVPNWRDDYSQASDLHSGDEVYVAQRSWFARNALSVASTALVLVSVLVSAFR